MLNKISKWSFMTLKKNPVTSVTLKAFLIMYSGLYYHFLCMQIQYFMCREKIKLYFWSGFIPEQLTIVAGGEWICYCYCSRMDERDSVMVISILPIGTSGTNPSVAYILTLLNKSCCGDVLCNSQSACGNSVPIVERTTLHNSICNCQEGLPKVLAFVIYRKISGRFLSGSESHSDFTVVIAWH